MDIANFVRATFKGQELRYNLIAALLVIALCLGGSESASFGVFIFTKFLALLSLTLVYLLSRDPMDEKDSVSLKGGYAWSPAAVQSGYRKLNPVQPSGGIVRYDQDTPKTEKEVLILGYGEAVERKHTIPSRSGRRLISAKPRGKRPKLRKTELADKQLSLW